MNQMIIWLEELSMNALPSLTTKLFDGWVLRFSEGYTIGANSVNPLYQSSYELEYKIDYCEKKYSYENLPVIYKLTENAPKQLDKILEQKKYELKNESKVMTLPLSNLNLPIQPNVNVFRKVDLKWLKGFFRLTNITNKNKQNTATKIINNIENDIICVYIETNGIIVACGLGIVERGFVGLFDINVAFAYRRKGFGTQICKAILREAIKLGAYTSYLQVVNLNKPALKLYKSIGFSEQYKYWYRIKT